MNFAKMRVRGPLADGSYGLYCGVRKVGRYTVIDEALRALRDAEIPIQKYGQAINPVTGELAAADMMWVRNVMGDRNWIQISNRTPYSCSPSSEGYWSS